MGIFTFPSQDTLEMIKMNLITSEAFEILKRDFQYFEEALTDFIDSSEIPHDQRQRIIQFSQVLKDQVQSYPLLVCILAYRSSSLLIQ